MAADSVSVSVRVFEWEIFKWPRARATVCCVWGAWYTWSVRAWGVLWGFGIHSGLDFKCLDIDKETRRPTRKIQLRPWLVFYWRRKEPGEGK